jgi:hypothetical protein
MRPAYCHSSLVQYLRINATVVPKIFKLFKSDTFDAGRFQQFPVAISTSFMLLLFKKHNFPVTVFAWDICFFKKASESGEN